MTSSGSFDFQKIKNIDYGKTIFLIGTLLATAMFATAGMAFYYGVTNYSRLGTLRRLVILPALEIVVCFILLIGPLRIYSRLLQPGEKAFNYSDLTFYCSEIYNIGEFIIVMDFLRHLFNKSRARKIIRLISISGTLLLITLLAHSSDDQVATYNYATSSLIITLCLVAYFKSLIEIKGNFNYLKDPYFIIASGFFIQFTLTFPTSIFLHGLNYSDQRISNIITIVNYSAYTFYFYFIYKGFQCQAESKRPSL